MTAAELAEEIRLVLIERIPDPAKVGRIMAILDDYYEGIEREEDAET